MQTIGADVLDETHVKLRRARSPRLCLPCPIIVITFPRCLAGKPGMQTVGADVLDETHAKLRDNTLPPASPPSPCLKQLPQADFVFRVASRASLACRPSALMCSTRRM